MDANVCTRFRFAATMAGCTVAASAVSNAAAVAMACPAAPSAWAAAALSHPTYWVATAIIAADEAPCHELATRSDATELNEVADEARSWASPSHAVAAARSGAAPAPANMSAELISGGNHAKCAH